MKFSRRTALKRAAIVTGMGYLALAAWHFPWATDEPVKREEAIKAFYEVFYSRSASTVVKDNPLTKQATDAATTYNVPGEVRQFVDTYRLHRAKVLDVGSGVGYLQDIVDDYTGLDISAEAARFYHKPFVAGTATAMPFADSQFDAAWSIWVYEHIPSPEAALVEIRRVVKPGGLILMWPAWDAKPWAADGYEARPYSDFGLTGKVVKASTPFRRTKLFWFVANVPSRIARAPASRFGPTRLHYGRLTPNYQEYWQADSDAVNSLDSVEMAMWFESRGDTCLNCWPGWKRYVQPNMPLIIRVKPNGIGAQALMAE